jgi:hypothetical protein
MAWKDVCKRGRPAGGKVREDDPKGGVPKDHDAGGSSPGILKFVREVVRMTPTPNFPAKPAGFPAGCRIDDYPGRGGIDTHFEGRAVDVFLDAGNAAEKEAGEWLFDWCVANCRLHQIQGVIYDKRQWFSEKREVLAGGGPIPYAGGDHWNHVHVELNCDGAALSKSGATAAAGAVAGDLSGTWNVTIGTWKGLFVFDAFGGAYWAENERSARHNGKWTATGTGVQWKFEDAGDFRTFTVQTPLNKAATQGQILPAGQGFFEMKKAN